MDGYANTSSSPDVLPPSPPPSSDNSSLIPPSGGCFGSPPGSSIYAAFTATNILLLLPLSVFILCFGAQQRWRRRARPNPTDVFTYHMVAMETIGMAGSVACCCGAFAGDGALLHAGCNTFAIISCMKMFFHVLTCVERYVAIVRPIVYLSLSQTSGAAIRNGSIACVWLACSGLIALRLLIPTNFIVILFFCNLVVSLIVTSYCSLSVLRVLVRPPPGEEGGSKREADDTKRRAFVTITAIMAVLLLRFGGNLVCMALASSPALSVPVGCAVRVAGVWFCLPSSYVLPLLFLHRAEKLRCFSCNSESS